MARTPSDFGRSKAFHLGAASSAATSQGITAGAAEQREQARSAARANGAGPIRSRSANGEETIWFITRRGQRPVAQRQLVASRARRRSSRNAELETSEPAPHSELPERILGSVDHWRRAGFLTRRWP